MDTRDIEKAAYPPPSGAPGTDGRALPLTRRRVRRVTVILLLAEAGGLVLLVATTATGIEWKAELARGASSGQLAGFWVQQAAAVPVVILALAAAVSLMFRFRHGWLLAMLAQGILLSNALLNYFRERPNWVYPLLAVGILLALFLNTYGVRSGLQASERAKPGADHEG